MTEGVIDKCLPCATWTIQKEHATMAASNRVKDMFICTLLILIEPRFTLCNPISFCVTVIIELLVDQGILNVGLPIVTGEWHGREV